MYGVSNLIEYVLQRYTVTQLYCLFTCITWHFIVVIEKELFNYTNMFTKIIALSFFAFKAYQ